jgi:hypothetical protein
MEKKQVKEMIVAYKGNLREASRKLDIPRTTLRARVERFKLQSFLEKTRQQNASGESEPVEQMPAQDVQTDEGLHPVMVRLDVATYRRLRVVAASEYMSMSAYVARAVEAFLLEVDLREDAAEKNGKGSATNDNVMLLAEALAEALARFIK